MDTNKKEDEKNKNTKQNPPEDKKKETSDNNDSKPQNQPTETIIDLPKLAGQSEIQNSDIILAIFEICTFNKKYNYECSNNTKAFWERVVGEEVLKKIFINFSLCLTISINLSLFPVSLIIFQYFRRVSDLNCLKIFFRTSSSTTLSQKAFVLFEHS